jgi:2-hydroxychromene-2-carboxylate isomerase
MQRDDPAAARTLARGLFEALFVSDRDIGDPAVVIEVAAGQGMDRAALATALADPEVKGLPRAATERAMQAGVFGSPFFMVDGEPFWGNDRLDQVIAQLEQTSAR